jgi:toxin FitB
MPACLLDTNVVTQLRKQRPHGTVLAWLQGLNPTKAAEIEAWLELLASAYNVLPMDAATFRAWARLMHRKSDALYEDAMIAGTAQVHGLIVATRHVADFHALGFEVCNPFAAA